MGELMKNFWEEEDGMGVVEIVMIIAALMCIALLFKDRVYKFAKGIMDNVFKTDLVETPKK